MPTAATGVLSSIQSLPLSDEAKSLFSRAVQLEQHGPGDFAPVAAWLDKHYSETALREFCKRRYRYEIAARLRGLREESPSYRRRLAIRQGATKRQLVQDTVAEATLRGRRFDGNRPGTWPDGRGAPVNAKNAHLVWIWEDDQYRQQRRRIRELFKQSEFSEYDHPDQPDWRLRRAVEELVAAEYPDGADHIEHSRKIVALAALLMPEPLPVLGEFGNWPFGSTLDLPKEPTGDWFADAINAQSKRLSEGPHGHRTDVLDSRKVGREEVLFERLPGQSRQVQRDFPLDTLLKLLPVALDELEALTPQPTWTALGGASASPVAGVTGQVGQGAMDTAGETGLVADPTDKNAYREANKIINEHPDIAKDIKALNRILADHPEIRRWKPRQNRLSVHVGDWLKYVDAQDQGTQLPQEETRSPDVKPIMPTAGVVRAGPAIQSWRCRGCQADYADQLARCEKCGGGSFEPVIARDSTTQQRRRK